MVKFVVERGEVCRRDVCGSVATSTYVETVVAWPATIIRADLREWLDAKLMLAEDGLTDAEMQSIGWDEFADDEACGSDVFDGLEEAFAERLNELGISVFDWPAYCLDEAEEASVDLAAECDAPLDAA